MFGSFAYYSLPAQRVSLESIVTSEWQKPGFVCKPLQKTTLHGLSTDWSFDECLANVIAPDTTNVNAATKHANVVHYDYNFASDGDSNKGVVSVYDVAYASSVLQKTNQASDDWKRDGYSCYPEPPYDNTFNVHYNHSECLDVVLPPSAATVQSQSPNGYGFSYHPFGNEFSLGYPCSASLVSRLLTAHSSCPIMPPCSGSCQCIYAKFLPSGAVINTWCDETKPYYVFGGGFYAGMQNMLDASGSITLDLAIKGWNDILNTQADQHGGFGNEFMCSFLKLNGNGFRCFDKPKPPATKEVAIQQYASEYPPETICAPLKLNSPFQCTRNVEVPAPTRLSLSVAAAQAVFALTGIALVALLRKLQMPSTTTSESLSTDGDLRSMMRKLRIELHSTVDQLRTGQDQLCTGQDQLHTGQDQLRAGQGTHEELIQKLLSKEGGR
mmetsp:Transcript_12214/g.49033  ORF Transcript_12214/g.49033 Transcript_12214/m.49033 type:complete len:440 (-) Transcript_12214:352-1671(-)